MTSDNIKERNLLCSILTALNYGFLFSSQRHEWYFSKIYKLLFSDSCCRVVGGIFFFLCGVSTILNHWFTMVVKLALSSIVSQYCNFKIVLLFLTLFVSFAATVLARLVLAGLVKVLDEVGDVIVVVLLVDGLAGALSPAGGGGCGGLSGAHAGGQPPEVLQRLGPQLVEDAGEHLGDLFGLGLARHGEGVGGQRGLHLRVVEVDHRTVVLHHVYLLDAGDVVDREFL